MSEQLYDDRAESFLHVGDVAYQIATKYCRVEVDEVTHRRWRELLGLLREVDTMHDDLGMTAPEVIEQLGTFDEFAERYPELAPDRIGEETHQRLIGRTQQLLKIGRYISTADSVNRFVALRVNEGRHTANLLSDSATPKTRRQERFTTSFLPTIQSLGICASTIDSMIDGRMDRRDQKIAVDLTKEYYGKLGGATLRHLFPGMMAPLHPRVLYEFGVMSKNRLKNRLTHPQSETTSLRIFQDPS